MYYSCKECDGSGTIEQDGKLKNCECFYVKQAALSMPPYIRHAVILPQHLELPVLKIINNISPWCRSIFMRGSCADLNAIIKALLLKYPTKWIKLTSDAEIRNVYVGSMSKSARSDDYAGAIYNNIQDLIDPPQLIVIRLNTIANKNKAAPGALEEALNHRLMNDKPVWAYSDDEDAFNPGSFAYSLRVNELLTKSMKEIRIPIIAPESSIEERGLSPDFIPQKHPVLPERPQIKEKEYVDKSDPLSGYGVGVKKKKSPFGRPS